MFQYAKRLLTLFIAVLLLYSNTGVMLYKHTCNTSNQSFFNIVEGSCNSYCCKGEKDCAVDIPCCKDDFVFKKFNYETLLKISSLDVELKIISNFYAQNYNYFILSAFQNNAKNRISNSIKYYTYLQPNIYKLQVFRC